MLAEVEQVRTKLWYVEFYFAWMPLVQYIEIPKDFVLVLAGIKRHDEREDLILFVGSVVALLRLLLARQLCNSLTICLNELLYFSPSLFPVFFVSNTFYKLFEFYLRHHFLLLLNFLVLGVECGRELHSLDWCRWVVVGEVDVALRIHCLDSVGGRRWTTVCLQTHASLSFIRLLFLQ